MRLSNVVNKDMDKLNTALKVFLDHEHEVDKLASVLVVLSEKGTVSYDDVEEISGESTEDVLLIGWKWRLLIPMRTSRSGEWDDRLLIAETGELYQIPNVVKYLIDNARFTGEWNSNIAITRLFKDMEEPAYRLIPELVRKMFEKAAEYKVNAVQIRAACREVGLEDRVDTMIAILKGSGIMSPNLAPLAQVIRTGSPLYELNPCLFAENR